LRLPAALATALLSRHRPTLASSSRAVCLCSPSVLTRFLLLFGGLGIDLAPMTDVNLFDIETSTWTVHRPSPSLPRIGHVAGYASGSLYVFGGTDGSASSSDLFKVDCDALFPQTAALSFDTDPSKVMIVRPSPSLNALSDRFTVECWVKPKSFAPNAPAVVRSNSAYSNGFGLVALDEATARKYVQLEKEKNRPDGARNPWESCLADAEKLPTVRHAPIAPRDDRTRTSVTGGAWADGARAAACSRAAACAFDVWLDGGVQVAFFVGGFKKETSALMRVEPDAWSHLAATFDGRSLITYVNGRRADCITPDPPFEEPPPHPRDGELYVGAMPGKAGWDGLVDAVRVWNLPLDWETLRANMNETLLGSQHPSMIGQWTCNEGAGWQVWDSSSRGNHGYIEGDVPRVMCTRDRMVFERPVTERVVDDSFEQLREWRAEFEKRAGRPITQEDVLGAEESIRKTALRMGLI
jgi:hypothetical protein